MLKYSHSRTILLLLMVLLIFSTALFSGCTQGYQNKTTGQLVTKDYYNNSVPADQKANWTPTKVVTGSTAEFVDAIVGTGEGVVAVISPFMAGIAWLTPLLTLFAGAFATWRKLKPQITALDETVKGIEVTRDTAGKLPPAVASALSEAQSNTTKLIIAEKTI